MKILINAFSAKLGGGQTYLINLLAYLPNNDDLEIFVYAPRSLKLPEDKRIMRCSTLWPTNNPIFRSIWEKFILPWFLRYKCIDILFCPGGTINTTPPSGCKTVTMFRNMIPFDMRVRQNLPLGIQKFRNWLLEHIMLKSMASADLTIFISEYARSIIEKRIEIPRAITIPHGINPIFRTFGKKINRIFCSSADKYILYVSRFDIYKHHNEVVKAFASLPISLQQEYKLLFAGECESPETKFVINLIKNLGLNDRIVILGAIPYEELPSLYHHADLILFASSCENCPNILLEALGAGRPVLSSNVEPMPEFGGDGIGYFSPFNSEDIALQIKNTLTSTRLSDEIASAAALRSNQFDWAISAEKTWEQILCLAKLGVVNKRGK